MATILLKLILTPFYLFYLLVWCVTELSGEGRWYRRQRRTMVDDRPPLTDDEFLLAVNAAAADEHLWLAVRRAVAEQAGVPAEAIVPRDHLADLWRMQWCGPDLLDFQFRMERILGRKLVSASVSRFLGLVRYGQPGEFHEFAEAVVRGVRARSESSS